MKDEADLRARVDRRAALATCGRANRWVSGDPSQLGGNLEGEEGTMRLRLAVAVLTVAVGLLGPLGSAPAIARTCTITGTAQSDNINGTSGRDVICARAGGDRVVARGGNDAVFGAKGRDLIAGDS